MFEDVEDEFELDLIHQRDSDDEEEKKSATRRRLSKKMNFSQVIPISDSSEFNENFYFIPNDPLKASGENERRHREREARAN